MLLRQHKQRLNPPGVEEGEAICAQLLLVARGASVSRDDYYSAEEGWDLMGLSSDLEIFSSY